MQSDIYILDRIVNKNEDFGILKNNYCQTNNDIEDADN